MKLEFNYKNVPPETLEEITSSLNKNLPFGLQSALGNTIIFIPKFNVVIFPPSPTTYINPFPTKQVCNDRRAFEAVIGMSLFRYTFFVSHYDKRVSKYLENLPLYKLIS